MMQTVLSILRYIIVWYANNFAAPFWMIGHYHLAVNNFSQLEKIGGMVLINMITILGIYLDWKMQHSETTVSEEKLLEEHMSYFVIDKRCTAEEISSRTEFGVRSRGINLEDIVFSREDETHLYVFYKHR